MFVLVSIDYGFRWAGGDWMEVGVWMGAHDDDGYGFVELRSRLFEMVKPPYCSEEKVAC